MAQIACSHYPAVAGATAGDLRRPVSYLQLLSPPSSSLFDAEPSSPYHQFTIQVSSHCCICFGALCLLSVLAAPFCSAALVCSVIFFFLPGAPLTLAWFGSTASSPAQLFYCPHCCSCSWQVSLFPPVVVAVVAVSNRSWLLTVRTKVEKS